MFRRGRLVEAIERNASTTLCRVYEGIRAPVDIPGRQHRITFRRGYGEEIINNHGVKEMPEGYGGELLSAEDVGSNPVEGVTLKADRGVDIVDRCGIEAVEFSIVQWYCIPGVTAGERRRRLFCVEIASGTVP
jgi:hypothetical protein